MPLMRNPETGEAEAVASSQVSQAAQGGMEYLPDEKYDFVDRSGKTVSIPGSSVATALQRGFRQHDLNVSDVVDDARERAQQDTYGGIGGQLQTAVEGVARGATFGLSDIALQGLGEEASALSGRAQANPATAFGSELVGAIAPSLFTGGAGAAGTVARAIPSGALAARAGALGTKVGGGLRGAVVAGGFEGSVFGAGQAVSRLALTDEPLTAEAVFAEIGTGALLGGGLGAAGGALGAGLEAAGAGMAKIGGKVKDRLVRKATPALDVASKEGKALYANLARATDDLDEVIERAVAKAESRSVSGFRFAGNDDVAEASFLALRKQKSEALDYAQAASSKLPANVEKAATRVEQAERKIASILSNRRGSIDFAKTSALSQKQLGSLSRAFDDYSGAVGKLADETGSPFQAVPPPVTSGITPKIDGSEELAKVAREAQAGFRKKLGEKGIKGLAEQTPEQALETVKALQEATDRAAILAKHVGGKEADALARINDDISKAIGGATSQKLPEVAELALALGVEEAVIPDVDGPADELLKLYLATKLVGKYGGAGGLADKALGRAASKVPGSKLLDVADGFVSDTIGRLASATGKATERVSAGLQKALKTGTAGVKRSSPLTTQILSEVSFGDTGQRKPHNKRDAFAMRSRELSEAVANPEVLDGRVSQRLDGMRQVSPEIAERVARLNRATVEFLHARMPKDHGVLQHFGKSKWRPTDGELDKFARYVRAVKDPAGIIERFGDFRMTREDSEVLRALYPAHYRKVQLWVMDNLEELAKKSTYKQRVQMSLLMNTPADPIMAQAAFWQSQFEAPATAQAASRQGVGGSNRAEESAAQQLQKTGY